MNFKMEHASQAPTSSFSPPLPNAPFDVVDFGARDFRLYPTQLTSVRFAYLSLWLNTSRWLRSTDARQKGSIAASGHDMKPRGSS